MGHHLPTGMYRNAFRHERSIEYERHYRLTTMETMRWLMPRVGPYKRETKWFKQMYPKAMPSRYRPRMSRCSTTNPWDWPNEQMRIRRKHSNGVSDAG
jgi:hypothetical protein